MEQSLAERTAMIGADVQVPCLDGRTRRYVELDYAASTPAMAGVWAAVGGGRDGRERHGHVPASERSSSSPGTDGAASAWSAS